MREPHMPTTTTTTAISPDTDLSDEPPAHQPDEDLRGPIKPAPRWHAACYAAPTWSLFRPVVQVNSQARSLRYTT